MSDERADLERLRKLKRLRELEAKAQAEAPAAPVAAPAPTEPSGLEALGRGARQGALFGQSANLDGLIQALGEKYLPEANPKVLGVELPFGGGGGDAAKRASFADLFAQDKGTTQRGNDAAYEAHPWLYRGGYAAGSLPTMLIGGGAKAAQATEAALAARAGGNAANLAELTAAAPNALRAGVSNAATLGQLAKRGAGVGALWGAGNGVGAGLGDLLQGNYGQAAGHVGLNTLAGALGGGALAPVPALVSRAAPALKDFAYRQAVKAAGPLKGDILSLLTSGRLGSVGQKLMDMGLVPNAANIEKIAPGIASAAEARGTDVHNVLGELDALYRPRFPPNSAQTPNGLTALPPALQGRRVGNFPGMEDLASAAEGTVNQRVPGVPGLEPSPSPMPAELPGFNPAQVSTRLRKELLEPLRGLPSHQDLIPGLEKEIANLEAVGNRRLTFQRANEVKGGYDQRLNWDSKEPGASQELLRKLRGIVNNEIETKADDAANMAGTPELVSRFRSAKQDYRDLREVADFAQRALAGHEAKGPVSLYDMLAGGGTALAALATGHPLTALAGIGTATGSKLVRERGNAVAANLAYGLGRRLAIPGNLADLSARGLTSWAARARGQAMLSHLLGEGTLPWAPQGADVAQGAMQ